jgi:hypothetical protein
MHRLVTVSKKKGWTMSQNVTLLATISATQALALQTRCAPEALGIRAVGVLVEATQNQFMHPWRFRAACALLKLIGADKAESMPSLTAEEVQLAFQEREAALQTPQSSLRSSETANTRPVEVAESVRDSTAQAAPAAVPLDNSSSEPAGGKSGDNGTLSQALIDTLVKSFEGRGKQAERVSVLPISIDPCSTNGRSRGDERVTQSIAGINGNETAPNQQTCRGQCHK